MTLEPAVHSGCVVFTPVITVTHDYTVGGSESLTTSFEFGDPDSKLKIQKSGISDCTKFQLSMNVKPATFAEAGLDGDLSNFAEAIVFPLSACPIAITSIAAKVQGHDSDTAVYIKVTLPQSSGTLDADFVRSDGITTA